MVNPFTKEADLDWESLQNDIPVIVEAMDNIVDENLEFHALEEQKQMSYNYRNIGIGIMGLADVFIKMGIKYGSQESIDLAGQIMKFLFINALDASVNLGIQKGSFPKYSSKVWDSTIVKNTLPEELINHYKQVNCLRNCSLLSIAPTGSIGTALGVGTGAEPLFQIKYLRRTESLNKEETYYEVYSKVAKEYTEFIGNTELPDYFITAQEIDWKGRIAVQAALQNYCDTGISSTINLPKETTVKDIEGIYLEAWKQGLKGVTVYVDGSRTPILSTSINKPETITSTAAPKRPKELEADYYETKVKGEQFIVLVGLLEERPYEIFTIRSYDNWNNGQHKGKITKVSKMHYRFDSDKVHIDDLKPETENVEETAATLYSSMLLRHGVDIEYIIKTAKKVNDNITSFSSAMCRVLGKYTKPRETGEICPECGSKLIRTGGCISCPVCFYSRCS